MTSLGLPTDPRYINFRDGVLVANDDVLDALRWRWHPKSARWYKYPTSDFILDEVGIGDTDPGWGFDDIARGGEYEKARADMRLPDLFGRLDATYKKYSMTYPHLVWTWRTGGDWRVALRRVPGPDPDPTPERPDWKSKLPSLCVQRIEDVQEWVRQGTITAAVGQQLINKIVADCTVGPV